MNYKFYILYFLFLSLIGFVFYLANTKVRPLGCRTVSNNDSINRIYNIDSDYKLSEELQRGKELFRENCHVCHKSNICGPKILEDAFKDYDALGISWRKFLQGDWSNLIYLEVYDGISCKPAEPPFNEIRIDQLLSYLNYIKEHTVTY